MHKVVLIQPEGVLRSHELKSLDIVNLFLYQQGILIKKEKIEVIIYNIPKGNVASCFSKTNVLISHDQFADYSNTPDRK